MQIALYRTKEQFQALLADPTSGSALMSNLLRFERGGEAAYRCYATAMRKLVERRGRRVTAQGVGGGGAGFEIVGLVKYPSRNAFVEVAPSSELAAIGVQRREDLEGHSLLATTAELIC